MASLLNSHRTELLVLPSRVGQQLSKYLQRIRKGRAFTIKMSYVSGHSFMPYLYLGNFSRKPHYYSYSVNKCYNRIPLLSSNTAATTIRTSITHGGSNNHNGQKQEAASAIMANVPSSTTGNVGQLTNDDEALRQISRSVARGTKHLRRIIKHYNAMSMNFFNADRLNETVQKTRNLLKLGENNEQRAMPPSSSSPYPITVSVAAAGQRRGPQMTIPTHLARHRNFAGKQRSCSHIIEVTFNKAMNKNSLPPKVYSNVLQALLPQCQVKFVRHFKTERSIAADLKRNPTMMSRVKTVFSGNVKLEETMSNSESLKRLLKKTSESSGSKNDEDNIKVAFAEGYLAAKDNDESPKTGKTLKYLKVFQQLLVIAVFIGLFIGLFSSTNGSVFRIQLGNQVEVDPEEIHVTFDDVKGCDEAKQELKEVVEFLKNPEKFSNLGGKLPKGVLLVGPPGTGKTLLARAVAGEANVPFFHAAGPEFDEVLVGQGARRVRDLFKAAKQRAPCVIFIDEIDSVGAKRTNSVLHPYANQTINQLLSEMDGFHQNAGVIVLGATNRRDDLDQALLRPGRFDVEVVVNTPDFSGRKEIITLYLSKILHDEIDLDILARGTSGFTGADLENMINQAALRAAIDGAETVTMRHLETARDKVLMGPERKARLPDEEANLITAYHEGGHAIVAYYTKESHPLHKVTIMPRGPSLGHTAYIPEKERYHVTKAQLLAMMDTMMGGRAAEELIFGADKITSGASSDLKQATNIATHMVKDWGMSEKVGLRTIENAKGVYANESLGPNTVEAVDTEIRRILNESYERAKNILRKHAKEHKALAEALLKYETLDAEDIKAIMRDSH